MKAIVVSAVVLVLPACLNREGPVSEARAPHLTSADAVATVDTPFEMAAGFHRCEPQGGFVYEQHLEEKTELRNLGDKVCVRRIRYFQQAGTRDASTPLGLPAEEVQPTVTLAADGRESAPFSLAVGASPELVLVCRHDVPGSVLLAPVKRLVQEGCIPNDGLLSGATKLVELRGPKPRYGVYANGTLARYRFD